MGRLYLGTFATPDIAAAACRRAVAILDLVGLWFCPDCEVFQAIEEGTVCDCGRPMEEIKPAPLTGIQKYFGKSDGL